MQQQLQTHNAIVDNIAYVIEHYVTFLTDTSYHELDVYTNDGLYTRVGAFADKYSYDIDIVIFYEQTPLCCTVSIQAYIKQMIVSYHE